MKFSNGTSGKINAVIGDHVRVGGSMTLPVQDNLSVTMTDKINIDEWLRGNQEGAQYQFGVGVELKL
jgi:hypothetical protein